MKCLQCESSRIVSGVRPVDHGHGGTTYNLSLEAYANPNAWLFKEAHASPMLANVCADCGYVMFYVSVSEALRLERQKELGEKRNRS